MSSENQDQQFLSLDEIKKGFEQEKVNFTNKRKLNDDPDLLKRNGDSNVLVEENKPVPPPPSNDEDEELADASEDEQSFDEDFDFFADGEESLLLNSEPVKEFSYNQPLPVLAALRIIKKIQAQSPTLTDEHLDQYMNLVNAVSYFNSIKEGKDLLALAHDSARNFQTISKEEFETAMQLAKENASSIQLTKLDDSLGYSSALYVDYYDFFSALNADMRISDDEMLIVNQAKIDRAIALSLLKKALNLDYRRFAPESVHPKNAGDVHRTFIDRVTLFDYLVDTLFRNVELVSSQTANKQECKFGFVEVSQNLGIRNAFTDVKVESPMQNFVQFFYFSLLKGKTVRRDTVEKCRVEYMMKLMAELETGAKIGQLYKDMNFDRAKMYTRMSKACGIDRIFAQVEAAFGKTELLKEEHTKQNVKDLLFLFIIAIEFEKNNKERPSFYEFNNLELLEENRLELRRTHTAAMKALAESVENHVGAISNSAISNKTPLKVTFKQRIEAIKFFLRERENASSESVALIFSAVDETKISDLHAKIFYLSSESEISRNHFRSLDEIYNKIKSDKDIKFLYFDSAMRNRGIAEESVFITFQNDLYRLKGINVIVPLDAKPNNAKNITHNSALFKQRHLNLYDSGNCFLRLAEFVEVEENQLDVNGNENQYWTFIRDTTILKLVYGAKFRVAYRVEDFTNTYKITKEEYQTCIDDLATFLLQTSISTGSHRKVNNGSLVPFTKALLDNMDVEMKDVPNVERVVRMKLGKR